MTRYYDVPPLTEKQLSMLHCALVSQKNAATANGHVWPDHQANARLRTILAEAPHAPTSDTPPMSRERAGYVRSLAERTDALVAEEI